MKHLFKLSLLLLALMVPATASATRIEIDSIYYDIEGSKATVTYEYVTIVYMNGTVTYYYSSDYSGNIVIPETITYNDTTYTVDSIGFCAFSGCSGLTSISIPNSVTSIGELAFKGCNNLAYIIIPDSVTYIGNRVFENCTGLTDITIPNSVTDIGSSAFSGCSGLNSVIIGNSVTCIMDSTFCNCTSLSNIDIPNSVTSIGNRAFFGCSGLTSINIPNSVTTISDGAFYHCIGLTSVTIGTAVATISNYAFEFCTSLTSIIVESGNPNYDSRDNCNAIIKTSCNTLIVGCMNTIIPNSVTSIGYEAFYGCSGLTSITIPNSVTSIAERAFACCSGLTSISIPNSVTSIGSSTFESCGGLTSIDIPNSVTSIGSEAFRYCIGLTSITIPDSVTIGDYAFSGCSGLTSVIIPNSVSRIGNDAFRDCTRLKDVYCYIHDPSCVTLGYDVFYLHDTWRYALRTLHVPVGSLADYQVSDWFYYFGSFVEMDEGGKVTAIELDKQAAVIIEGESLQLTAIITPEDATNKVVSWASSKPNVATVDENGLVTAMGLGSATITAVTTDGSNLSASCDVTIISLSADNCFMVPDTAVQHGESITIPIRMINNETIMAFQTDIYLPDGFSIMTDDENEYLVTPSSRLTGDHILMANDNNGIVNVVCYTPNSQPIDGSSGDDLFYITIRVPEDAVGDYTIYLRNSRLTTENYTELRLPDAGAVLTVRSFIPGDANDSQSVTVTDIVVTAQYILQLNPNPFIFGAADMNNDGEVTVTDIMLIAYLINHPTMYAPKRAPALMTCCDQMSGEGICLNVGETRTVSIMLDNETDYTAFQMDLTLPEGISASNFQLTDRAVNHAFGINAIEGNKLRALCYSPAIEAIEGHEGALLTFDVTATSEIEGSIIVDSIELVTTDCQTLLFDGFTIGVNNVTSVNELSNSKTVARVDYYNLAGQRIDRPESGVTLVVTTYTDGTCIATKLIK